MQLTFPAGTAPFVVAELNVHATVRTRVPAGWSTVMVALVNAISILCALYRGQPGPAGNVFTSATLDIRCNRRVNQGDRPV